MVIDGLWRPYSFEISVAFISFLDIDYGGRPVDEVIGFKKSKTAVGIPSVGTHHVCHHHIEVFPVFATHDVRIPDSTGLAYESGVNDRTIVIQGCKIETIAADGEFYGLVPFVIACEVSEKITSEGGGGVGQVAAAECSRYKYGLQKVVPYHDYNF